MKAEAYRYAEGAQDENGNPPPITRELSMLGYIDRFGALAVLGRPVLSHGEIQRMLMAENVKNAYLSRKKSDNWGKWAEQNPQADTLLKEIETEILNDDD